MNNLKKIRLEKNISLTDISEKLGKSLPNICYFEKKRLTEEAALQCSELLNINVFELLGEDMFTIKPKTKKDIESIKKYLDSLQLED